MNQTFNNVKLLGKLFYNDQDFIDSTNVKALNSVSQFERLSNLNITKLLNDDLIVNKSLEVLNNTKLKNVRTLSVLYEEDLDENAQPRIQRKAFSESDRLQIIESKENIEEIKTDILEVTAELEGRIEEVQGELESQIDGLQDQIDNFAPSSNLDSFPAVDNKSTSLRAITNWNFYSTPVISWISVCWSPQLRIFVAVGEASLISVVNRVMYSSDGINWTSVNVEANNWISVCWSPELSIFVAVASSGPGSYVMTSPNGINWTPRTVTNNGWVDVCWSPELMLFCAVAISGVNRVMTSSDGVIWNENGIGTNNWRAICWSSKLGLFVAMANGGDGMRIARSTNGVNWTSSSFNSTIETFFSVIWCNDLNKFFAVSSTGDVGRIWSSSNGIDWVKKTTPLETWRGIMWSRDLGILLVCSINGPSGLMSSADGETWTIRNFSPSNWRGISWSPQLGIFVIVGSSGTNRIATSSFKTRPPKSENVFDHPSNSIDENGNWNFKINNIQFKDGNTINDYSIEMDDLNSTLDFKTTKEWGKYIFSTNDSGTDSSILQLSNSEIRANRNIVLDSGLNISQTGSSIISQAVDSSGVNLFKRSTIRSNFGESLNDAFNIVDNINTRGVVFIPRAPNSGIFSLTTAGDSVITNRTRPVGESVGIVVALEDSGNTGLKLASAASGVGILTLNQGSTTLTLNHSATHPITVNNKFRFVGTTAGTRRLENISTASFQDQGGGGQVFEMVVVGNETRYVNYSNGQYHQFWTHNGATHAVRFQILHNATIIDNQLQLRSSTATTQQQITTGTDGVADYFNTSAGAIDSSFRFRCRNSVGTTITPISFLPNEIQVNVPFDIRNETTSTIQNQLTVLSDGTSDFLSTSSSAINSSFSFRCRNSAGTNITPISFLTDQIQVNVPLHVRNSTTNSTQSQISVGNDGITDIFSTSSSAINSGIRFRCRNSGGTIVTPISMTAQTGSSIPLTTLSGLIDSINIENPGTLAQMGRVTRISKSSYNNITSGFGSVQNIYSFFFSFRGTYLVNYSIYIKNPDGTHTATIQDLQIGVGTSASALDIEESQLRKNSLTLTAGQEIIEQLPSTVRISPVLGLDLYQNLRIQYTTSGASLQVAIAFSVTRLI